MPSADRDDRIVRLLESIRRWLIALTALVGALVAVLVAPWLPQPMLAMAAVLVFGLLAVVPFYILVSLFDRGDDLTQ